MELVKKREGNKLLVAVSGRLDTTTAPELEAVVKTELEGITEFTVDFENLEYISSAGLRVLLMAEKTMKDNGKFIVKSVNDIIMEVFEITKFSEILTIE
ncbi:MAG: STAS domain-containing protein [Eubacteriaceae bacterium]|nr:STAS domain-containing protein [Eubacteriaceae bacterium]